jgi:hypothetical protein
MTTYTAITDAEIDQDSPLTETLATKWRDNPIAITEGAAGAPRIVAGALDIGTGSASGTSVGGGTVVVGLSSNYSFIPNASVSGPGGVFNGLVTGSSVSFSGSSGIDYTYSVSWNYINV